MRTNYGICPGEAAGKRVKVRLRNGMKPSESWPADGRYGCRWTLTDHPFDITHWELA